MQILLIRHGESEADILNVHEGRAAFELTAKGRRQAKAMADCILSEIIAENMKKKFCWLYCHSYPWWND